MQSQPETVKDRKGVDTKVGDMVFYLRGSLAGDNYYETCGEVVQLNVRNRVVKLDTGDILHWHEFWQEQRF